MTHGTTHGYKVHACRCDACKAAMAAYGKARYVPKPLRQEHVNTLTSWWIDAPRVGMTALVEREHQQRMHQSNLGHGRGRPISTDEIAR